ncbi:hypothetical protein WMF39_25350 [Sorangium sp. So ce1504]
MTTEKKHRPGAPRCARGWARGRREGATPGDRPALRKDEAAFARHAALILGTRGGRFEELSLAYTRRCFEPLFGFYSVLARLDVEADYAAVEGAFLREAGLLG